LSSDLRSRRPPRSGRLLSLRRRAGEPAHLGWLALLLPRRVRGDGPGIPGPAHEPDRRRRLRSVSDAPGRVRRIRFFLAAALSLASGQGVERSASGDSLDESTTLRIRSPARALLVAAD